MAGAKTPYAVLMTGGKQYVVSPGDVITIEKLADVEKVGSKVSFDKVLLVDDGKELKLGNPFISGVVVKCEVTGAGKLKKIDVVKYKAKSRYLKTRGHRQPFTKVKIESIS